MTIKLTQIDELTLPDHTNLEHDDQCFYVGEYTARKSFNYSATNQLIYNLKKTPNKRGTREWYYKERAIKKAGYDFRALLGRKVLEGMTLVPIPPSKAKGDSQYDDRMLQILKVMTEDLSADIRELVLQHESTAPLHGSEEPRSVNALMENYFVDERLADHDPTGIILFDDLLTTGAHFKAAKNVLLARFPGTTIVGMFVARRAPETSEI